MSDPNNPSDRDRLEKLYREMSDEELGELAASAGDLTDEARDALEVEIARRKLTVDEPRRVYEETYPEKVDLVMAANFPFEMGALTAKTALESAGIQCFIWDDNTVRMNFGYSIPVGGVKVMVHPEDADAAREVFKAPIPDSFEAGEFGTCKLPRCPYCNSLDISPGSNGSYCKQCGAEWDEVPDPEPPAGAEPPEQ